MSEDIEKRQILVLVMSALMTAVVLTTTMFTKIDMPYGYLNLGDFVIMMITCIAPFKIALVAAGVGSALADVLSGYPLYFFFTLFIKMGEVVVIHYLINKKPFDKWVVVPFVAAGVFMAVMYGVANIMIMGDGNVFIVSVLGDLPQGLVSAGLATVLYPQYKRMSKYLRGS